MTDTTHSNAPAAQARTFADWLAHEMPAGTVIGDPRWWAPRILRAVARHTPAPVSAGAQEPVAVVGDVYQLLWAGSGPIAPLVAKHGLKVGSKLYAAPQAPAVQQAPLLSQVAPKVRAQPSEVPAVQAQAADGYPTLPPARYLGDNCSWGYTEADLRGYAEAARREAPAVQVGAGEREAVEIGSPALDADGKPVVWTAADEALLDVALAGMYPRRAAMSPAPAPVAAAEPPNVCGVCHEQEAFTGTCGGGRDSPKSLCFAGVRTAPAAVRVPSAADLWDAFAERVRTDAGVDKLVNILGSNAKLRALFLQGAAALAAPQAEQPAPALPTIKGASITGGYVVVTPAGWGDDKATVLRDAILAAFPVNPAFTPKPDSAAEQPAAREGGQ